jgi:predicted peptidase
MDESNLNEAVTAELGEATNHYFATFAEGTVLTDSGQTMEHMASFNHGYTIPAVRDWLFEQSK